MHHQHVLQVSLAYEPRFVFDADFFHPQPCFFFEPPASSCLDLGPSIVAHLGLVNAALTIF